MLTTSPLQQLTDQLVKTQTKVSMQETGSSCGYRIIWEKESQSTLFKKNLSFQDSVFP